MPSRYDVFYNGGFYHIYDKTIDHRRIFDEEMCNNFTDIFCYYRSGLSSNLRYSLFKKLPNDIFKHRWQEIFFQKYFTVEILSFSLQPNHYHFLIKQLKENGIIRFMSNISNSITRYYNVKNKRKGPLFLPQFRSKKIRSQEHLIYVSKYIHTNCYAHGLVKKLENIFEYPYSSIKSYTSDINAWEINTDIVMTSFGNNWEKYKKFILSNAMEQKMRELVKYTDDWNR